MGPSFLCVPFMFPDGKMTKNKKYVILFKYQRGTPFLKKQLTNYF